MGRRLVAAACQPLEALGLSLRARVVLVAMCNMAKDGDTPPRYYGGWAYLAQAQGYPVFTATAERATARAISELREAKLIEAPGQYAPGVRVEYAIRLGYPHPVESVDNR